MTFNISSWRIFFFLRKIGRRGWQVCTNYYIRSQSNNFEISLLWYRLHWHNHLAPITLPWRRRMWTRKPLQLLLLSLPLIQKTYVCLLDQINKYSIKIYHIFGDFGFRPTCRNLPEDQGWWITLQVWTLERCKGHIVFPYLKNEHLKEFKKNQCPVLKIISAFSFKL